MKQWFSQQRSLLWALFCSFALCAFAVGVFRARRVDDRYYLFSRIISLILGLYYTVDAWWTYRQQRRGARSAAPSATDLISQ